MITMPIELYTDGSCLKNPGPGATAYVIRYWETPEGSDMPVAKTMECAQGYLMTTNNRMEILAGVQGLDVVIGKLMDGTFAGATQVNLMTDSEYFCNAINQRWIDRWQRNNWMTSSFNGATPKPVKNKDLWEAVIDVRRRLQELSIALTITHIKGHNGHEFNERCDCLAKDAAGNPVGQLPDEGYEKTIANRR